MGRGAEALASSGTSGGYQLQPGVFLFFRTAAALLRCVNVKAHSPSAGAILNISAPTTALPYLHVAALLWCASVKIWNRAFAHSPRNHRRLALCGSNLRYRRFYKCFAVRSFQVPNLTLLCGRKGPSRGRSQRYSFSPSSSPAQFPRFSSRL